MPAYRPEPPFDHGNPGRIGILLINLGTPEAPTARALRPYLKEFLSDRRVVEMPRALWWLILNGVILNTRPKKSAEKYAQIWTEDGPPLRLHTERQCKLLKGVLGERLKAPHAVEYAMRYGTPSVARAISELKKQGCDRLLVVPLYPQYAASSTATAFDAVFRVLQRMRNVPALRTVRHYHDHPGYIRALAQSVREHWQHNGRAERLLMSFHGVPRAALDKGDPYHCECLKTGRLLAEELELGQDDYQVTFQSRFGPAKWLKPYTAATLETLGRGGIGRVDVICPGFAGDCLETLEEIALTGKALFLKAGGKEFHYIPALNERDDWMAALTDIVLENLQGWSGGADEPAALEQRRAPALAAGAKK